MPLSYKFLIALVVGVVGFAAGARVVSKHDALTYGKQISDLKAQQALELKAVSDAAAKQANATVAEMKQRMGLVNALNTHYNEEIKHANATIARLRNDRSVSLRIAGQCQAATGSQQLSSSSGAVTGTDGTVELAPAARQAYFDLRQAVMADSAKIASLQQYIHEQCGVK